MTGNGKIRYGAVLMEQHGLEPDRLLFCEGCCKEIAKYEEAVVVEREGGVLCLIHPRCKNGHVTVSREEAEKHVLAIFRSLIEGGSRGRARRKREAASVS